MSKNYISHGLKISDSQKEKIKLAIKIMKLLQSE